MDRSSTAILNPMPEIEALESWMSANVGGFKGPIAISKFQGGQSNPTFRVEAASGNYVLRRKPLGPTLPSAHAVDREFRVLSSMQSAGVPVPKVHSLCLDDSVIGSNFYIMDLIPGRLFWDPRLPELTAVERTSIFDSMNETIAKIHSLDADAIGLGDFGRKENYLQRQVSRWTRQYEASKTEPNEPMERLIEWIPQNIPAERPAAVVHGDYRLDNVLIHPTKPRIVAVLDWELSTLGNPIADFAYHTMTWRFSPTLFRGLSGVDFSALGIPTESEYLRCYLDRTGFAQPEDWEFYLILSMFRIAAILQGIAKRAEDGTAADTNARTVGSKALPIAALAWHMAKNR